MKQDMIDTLQKVHRVFRERNLSLSAAESCTGGFVSSCVTDLPGASLFFRGGIVAYSEELKKDVLCVSPDTLVRHGAVSEQTAREMAEGALRVTKSDYSLATTGNLGPDGIEGKEQGLVYIAACGGNRTVSRKVHCTGGREESKEQVTREVLSLLIDLVEDDKKSA